MKDYYPPGLEKLPEEGKFPCEYCGSANNIDDYEECPDCHDMNFCTKCRYCNSCEEQFVLCECESGEWTTPKDGECSSCTDSMEEDEECD